MTSYTSCVLIDPRACLGLGVIIHIKEVDNDFDRGPWFNGEAHNYPFCSIVANKQVILSSVLVIYEGRLIPQLVLESCPQASELIKQLLTTKPGPSQRRMDGTSQHAHYNQNIQPSTICGFSGQRTVYRAAQTISEPCSECKEHSKQMLTPPRP